jgi:hypothetical protein
MCNRELKLLPKTQIYTLPDLSVVLKKGIKTQPSRWPELVVHM